MGRSFALNVKRAYYVGIKPLKKSDRRRFEDVCRKIREALHLDHWRCEDYEFKGKNDNSTAEAGIWPKNSRVGIAIYDDFWTCSYLKQLRILIHEHIHCVLCQYTQFAQEVTECCSPASKLAYRSWYDQLDENATDHLEGVLYNLLKDRL